MILTFREGVILGCSFFAIGVAIRMYMQFRVRGADSFSSFRRGDLRAYRDLVRRGEASLWPMVLSNVLLATGFALTLIAILFLK
jgi:hypothetical protein